MAVAARLLFYKWVNCRKKMVVVMVVSIKMSNFVA